MNQTNIQKPKNLRTFISYVNEILNKQIQENKSNESASNTVIGVQHFQDTIKDDKDLEQTKNKIIQYSKSQSEVSRTLPFESHDTKIIFLQNFETT